MACTETVNDWLVVACPSLTETVITAAPVAFGNAVISSEPTVVGLT